MIRINSKQLWINLILIIVLIVSLMQIFLQLKYLIVGRGLYFGYENTMIWDVSVAFFWSFWLIGSLGLLLQRSWSFTFLFPTSILSILVSIATFSKAIHKPLDIQIITYLGLILSPVLLVYINWPTVKKQVGFTGKNYFLGSIFLVAFTILFLVIDQK